ncbi:hypothetical protein K7432_008827 [Basidiobolus ranarum]|uniref:Uncharacterized protein n=1 Tax=Basidiobolus ranarum TaxID=34480 RepID=A0ABR2WR92_9FUNG
MSSEVQYSVQEALAKQAEEYSGKWEQLQAAYNSLQVKHAQVEKYVEEMIGENSELKKGFLKDKAYLEHKNSRLLEIASLCQKETGSTDEERTIQVTPGKPKSSAFMHTTPESQMYTNPAPSSTMLSKSEVAKSGFLKKYLWGKKKLAYNSYEAVSVDPESESTTVVKGPIIKSPTGGVQVVFNDIATHRNIESEPATSPAIQALRAQHEKTPLSPFIKKARDLFRKTPAKSIVTTSDDNIFDSDSQSKKKIKKLRSKKAVTEQEISSNIQSIEKDSRTPIKSRLRQRNGPKPAY